MGVQDPLKLARHLELLGGTARYVNIINSRKSEINGLSQQCIALTEETERSTPAVAAIADAPAAAATAFFVRVSPDDTLINAIQTLAL